MSDDNKLSECTEEPFWWGCSPAPDLSCQQPRRLLFSRCMIIGLQASRFAGRFMESTPDFIVSPLRQAITFCFAHKHTLESEMCIFNWWFCFSQKATFCLWKPRKNLHQAHLLKTTAHCVLQSYVEQHDTWAKFSKRQSMAIISRSSFQSLFNLLALTLKSWQVRHIVNEKKCHVIILCVITTMSSRVRYYHLSLSKMAGEGLYGWFHHAYSITRCSCIDSWLVMD